MTEHRTQLRPVLVMRRTTPFTLPWRKMASTFEPGRDDATDETNPAPH
ncbi:MAG: hypothetical protein P8M20_10555 [Planctomycetaceae bacterium]|nr:hypothetical protein [Planctomycetaceae bacterium]